MTRVSLLVILSLSSWTAAANDFPTQARVEFVLGCMSERGGMSYDTLYPCVCLIDRIAESMSYEEFAEAEVFAQLRSTPGERGGVFRDPEKADVLTSMLETAQEEGESSCFVGGEPAQPSSEARRGPAPRDARPAVPQGTTPRAVPPNTAPAAPREPAPAVPRDVPQAVPRSPRAAAAATDAFSGEAGETGQEPGAASTADRPAEARASGDDR